MRTLHKLVTATALAVFSCFAAATIADTGSPKIEVSNLDPAGWARKSGDVAVTSVDLRDEDSSPYNLAITGEGEIEIDQPLDLRRKNGGGVTFYELRFSPGFDPKSETKDNPSLAAKMPSIDIGGAILGYRLSESEAGQRSAELVVYLGSGKGRGSKQEDQWMTTGVHFEVKDDGRVVGHAPIVVRADSQKGVWDLYLYGDLFLADLPYRERVENLIVKSVSARGASVKDISVTDFNPLFADENVDGIPDDFARELGGLSRDEINETTGATLLVEYMTRKKW